jgi:alpha-mannosidase
MNNLHFTNFQARQDGTRRYRYRFWPYRSAVTRADVHRHGRELLDPLAARQYSGPISRVGSMLSVEPSDQLLAELRPLGDRVVRVRLRNVADQPVDATVTWMGRRELARVAGHDAADVLLMVPQSW